MIKKYEECILLIGIKRKRLLRGPQPKQSQFTPLKSPTVNQSSRRKFNERRILVGSGVWEGI